MEIHHCTADSYITPKTPSNADVQHQCEKKKKKATVSPSPVLLAQDIASHQAIVISQFLG